MFTRSRVGEDVGTFVSSGKVGEVVVGYLDGLAFGAFVGVDVVGFVVGVPVGGEKLEFVG